MKKLTKFQEVSLIALRLVVAGIFIYAGYGKWSFWTTVPEGTPDGMLILIKFLSIVEPLGAVALIAGFLTRWAAAGLAIIMVGAIFILKFTMQVGLFTSPQGPGLDYNFLILVACLALIAFGAGRFSVDAMRKK